MSLKPYEIDALLYALYSQQRSSEKWAILSKRGASDALIKSSLGRMFGVQGGYVCERFWVYYWGGKNPRVNIKQAYQHPERVVKGSELIRLTRELLHIGPPGQVRLL